MQLFVVQKYLSLSVAIGTTDGYCAGLYIMYICTCLLMFFIVDLCLLFVISAALQMRVNLNAFFENKAFNQYTFTLGMEFTS